MNRLNDIINDNEFNLYQDLIIEYLENSLNTTIWYYEIDLENSAPKDNWKEGYNYEIIFKEPIQIHCFIGIKPTELSSYNSNNEIKIHEGGNLQVSFFNKHLKEQNIFIKNGDIIGYEITNEKFIYYEVVDNDRKNYDSKHSFGGYKSFYKNINCTPANIQNLNMQ